MKKITSLFCLSIFCALGGLRGAPASEPPKSAEQLRAGLEMAIRNQDTNAALALVNWQGISQEMKAELTAETSATAGSGAVAVKLLPLPADYQATNEFNGVRYFPNVRVLGLVQVVSKDPGNDEQIPYGESGGVFYLAAMRQEIFDAHPTKAISLGVSVMGLFPIGHPGILNGEYVYLEDRQERKAAFQCTNSFNVSFFGDGIQSCRVTKISGEGAYQLTINEDGKPVFDSDMQDTNEIVYVKK